MYIWTGALWEHTCRRARGVCEASVVLKCHYRSQGGGRRSKVRHQARRCGQFSVCESKRSPWGESSVCVCVCVCVYRIWFMIFKQFDVSVKFSEVSKSEVTHDRPLLVTGLWYWFRPLWKFNISWILTFGHSWETGKLKIVEIIWSFDFLASNFID